MPREEALFLADMLNAARVSVGFASGRGRTDLDRDLMFRYALVKAVEIVGEAASQISDETRAQHPLIRWRAITSMRNRLVHVYYDIDCDILWDTISVDIPVLIGLLPQTENTG